MMWWAWRPPFTAASTPNVKAIAERTPGRSESNLTAATHGRDQRDAERERVLGHRNTAAREQEGVVERVQERQQRRRR